MSWLDRLSVVAAGVCMFGFACFEWLHRSGMFWWFDSVY